MPTFSLVFCTLLCGADPVATDIVIRGATLYDGSGKPGVVGDLAIKGERIVAVGAFEVAGKPRVIDGKGLVVVPGFIDLHTHSDISIFSPTSKIPIAEPKTRDNLNYLTQGVTTIVTGNCGFGPVDVAGYLKLLDADSPGSNVCHLVPHNDLRREVMGNANRPPSKEELDKMKQFVERGMKAGAWGLATGLYYTPGNYAATDEVIELAKVAAAYRGFYASHMRDEGPDLLASIQETLKIGQEAKLPVHISHMKAWGRKNWDKAGDAVALVARAREEGQAVTADQYPYVASSTKLAAYLIPTKYLEGTQKDVVARFDDAELGPKVRKAIEESLASWDGGKSIRLASYPKKPEWQGKDLSAIAALEKKTPLDIVLEVERNGGAAAVNFSMNEEGVRLIMKQPFVATASDGGAMVPSDTFQHPRSYGTFPRKIGYYSIQEKVIPLEQAIRSATGLPADILRLPERGYLKVGYFADVVVFDPEKFRDTATFEKPHQYATGVRFLFVNGTATIDDGKFTEKRAGKPLRHIAGD